MMAGDSAPERSNGFLRSRVVQVHPSLRCNLACSHCYSSSGPTEDHEQGVEALVDKLRLLRSEGYDVVSFSGGEPLLYPGFADVCDEARRMGLRVVVITNGTTLTRKRVAHLSEAVDRVAVSLDGPPDLHDDLRGAGMFDRARRGIGRLRDAGIDFGIAHCATRRSMPSLPWLLEQCLGLGGQVLQIHPLVGIGRARGRSVSDLLRPVDAARLYLLAQVMSVQVGDRLQIQLDLAHTSQLAANACQHRVLDAEALPRRPRLSDLVNPVVLDERGALWPLAYGMAPWQRIAAPAIEEWSEELEGYVRGHAAPLRRLLARALAATSRLDAFIDWYSFVTEHSHEVRLAAPSGRRRRLEVTHAR